MKLTPNARICLLVAIGLLAFLYFSDPPRVARAGDEAPTPPPVPEGDPQ